MCVHLFLSFNHPTNEPTNHHSCVLSMGAYATLSDWVVKHIEHSSPYQHPGLTPARDLIKRIRTRNLYAFIGEVS
jgi:hypothetical protein